MAHNDKKAIMITFLGQLIFFVLGFGPAYAAPVVQAKPTAAMQFNDLKDVSETLKSLKADLSCTITAYYDPALTHPVEGNEWDMSANPPVNSKYVIRYLITVTNSGGLPAQNFGFKRRFIRPDGTSLVLDNTKTLGPGESLEIVQFFGPFASNAVENKLAALLIFLDSASQISEQNEFNNRCSSYIYFRQ